MKPAVTVLLLVVFLLGESFAGYSTGFRRTPKPKPRPEASVNPVVYPTRDHSKEHSHWKGHLDGSAVVEVGKDDESGSSKTEDIGRDNADKGEIDQEEKIPVDTKEGVPHTGSGHWIPVQDVPSIEDKNVPHDIPSTDEKKVHDIPSGEEIPHDVPSTEEKEIPHVPSDEEEKVPYDVPSIEDKNVPDNVPEISEKEDIPAIPDDKSIIEEHHPNSPDENTSKDVSIDIEGNPHPNIPDTEDTGDDFSENLPQPRPDIPKTPIVDEEIPIIPSIDSDDKPSGTHSDKPLNEDTSIHDVPGGPLDNGPGFVGPDVGVQSDIESDDKSDVAGPQPFPDISPEDESTGVKTELLEPYPIKVGGVTTNINLYELMENLELSRFLHLVEEALLKDMLTGEGPVTIFAPSDFALSKLDATTIRTLATNQELLRQFVLYHCVDGQIFGPSFEERDNSVLVTKFNRAIHLNQYGEGWFVNGKPITTRDKICKNGVIHVVDEPLYPYPTGDLMETLETLENFKIYTELIRNAKLEKELKGDVSYTMFAPTDVAFSKLPPANLEWLKWDIPAIKRMFRQLTVRGMYYTTWIPTANQQLVSIDEVTTLSLTGYPDSINVNGVGLTQHDITSSNGCIHTIDDIWFLSELGTPSSSSNRKKTH